MADSAGVAGHRTRAAAGWPARQLVDDERFEATFDGVTYPDQGLTIDAVLVFAAAGVAEQHGAKATAWPEYWAWPGPASPT